MIDPPPDLTRVRLRFRADEPTGELIARVATDPEAWRTGEVLKLDRGSMVAHVHPPARDGGGRGVGQGLEWGSGDGADGLVLKLRRLSMLDRLKNTFGFGRAERHRRGALLLARAGLAGPPVIAIADVRWNGGPAELLAMAFVRGRTLLDVLRESAHGIGPGVRDEHEVARAAGSSVRALLVINRFNRDHKASNLMLVEGWRDAPAARRLALLDAVAIRRVVAAHTGRGEAMERMLASLVLEPLGCGVPARRSLMMRCLIEAMPDSARSERHAMWRRVTARVRAHGDPTPRVDPLG